MIKFVLISSNNKLPEIFLQRFKEQVNTQIDFKIYW